MKKTRFIVLALVVALALAGAGYAWWTDRIETSTILNTGELNVELGTDVFSRIWIDSANGDRWIANKGDYVDNAYTVKPTVDGNSVAFEFKNLYPGTESYTQWSAKNTGSITATIKNIDVSYKTEGSQGGHKKHHKGHHGKPKKSVLEKELLVNGTFLYKDGQNDRYSVLGGIPTNTKLKDLKTELNKLLAGKSIRPGDEIVFGGDPQGVSSHMYFTVPASLKGDNGENETIELTIDFNFIQYNGYAGNSK